MLLLDRYEATVAALEAARGDAAAAICEHWRPLVASLEAAQDALRIRAENAEEDRDRLRRDLARAGQAGAVVRAAVATTAARQALQAALDDPGGAGAATQAASYRATAALLAQDAAVAALPEEPESTTEEES